MKLHHVGVIALIGLLVGCATPQGNLTQEQLADAKAPPVCRDKDECAIYWSKAQIWLATNSAWKIQLATDSVLQTYSATSNSTSPSFTVTKQPQANGSSKIVVSAVCANPYGCIPPVWESIYSFKHYLIGQ